MVAHDTTQSQESLFLEAIFLLHDAAQQQQQNCCKCLTHSSLTDCIPSFHTFASFSATTSFCVRLLVKRQEAKEKERPGIFMPEMQQQQRDQKGWSLGLQARTCGAGGLMGLPVSRVLSLRFGGLGGTRDLVRLNGAGTTFDSGP